ncbi:DUF7359 domain-containing protein [Paenibacillus sp. FSL H3-0333]|uniref:DUF7359 domain-containing protein n=1 Tax=Paenibacillus sp. FSL H3-0333 TaxID=2921373 RepID=UPI0030F5A150
MFRSINLSKKPYDLKMWIAKPNKNVISPNLREAYSKTLKIVLSGVHELNFSLPLVIDKKLDATDNPNVSKLKERFTMKLNLGKFEEWMIIDKVTRNMDDNCFEVKCYSLAYQLKYKRLQNYSADAVSIATVLTDTLDQTGWTIGEIDKELLSLYRSFDISSSNKLDFLNEVAEKYSAVLIYNNSERTVNYYKPENVGTNRGLKFSYGKYLENVQYEEDYDEVYTHLRVTGADDIGIHAYNPTGLGYLIDYSHYLYPFERDANRNIIQHSNYMEDDLAHAVMDFMTKIDLRKNDFNNFLAKLNGFQTQLTVKTNELNVLNTELKIILDNIAVTQESGGNTTALQTQKSTKESQIASKKTEINTVNSQITSVNNNIEALKLDLSYRTNFTDAQYQELILNYIQEGEISESNISDELELYEYGIEQLELKRSPKINLTVDIINFLQCLSEQRNWDKLIIGDQVTIYNDKLKVNTKANLSSIEYDFNNGGIQVEIKDIQKRDTAETRYFKKLLKFAETEKSQKAAKIALENLTYNFNTRNDRISTVPADPIIANDGTAIDHVQNTDGSVDISFEWKYNLTNSQADEYNIDGFIVYIRTLTTNEKYTFGSTIAKEDRREVTADKRAVLISGVPANRYYTFGIQSYRRVDQDIVPTGILTSNTVKSLYANENPYQPSSTVPFYGNVLGTIDGQNVDSSRIVEWDSAYDALPFIDLQIQEVNDSLAQLDNNIDTLFTDKVITSIEANSLDNALTQVKKESEDLITVSTSLGITTEKTAYAAALANLDNELSANWLHQAIYPKNITTVQRDAIKSKFASVQDMKSKLINKIAAIRQANTTSYIDAEIVGVNSTLNTLNSQINSFSSDLNITLAEANALELSYSQVIKESENIVSIASSLSITTERTNYSSALAALTTEINKWINKTYPLAISSTDRTNVQTKFENVQNLKSILINKISAVREANSKTYADQQISELDTSLNTLSSQVKEFSNDNKLTLAEANALEISLNQVVKESEDIVSIAGTLSITTEKSTYSSAISNLQIEMNNWINKSTYPITITSANRTSIQSKFEAVQSAKSVLINKIASVREANAKTYTDTTANAKLAEIAADDKLTPIEKSSTKLEWDVIVSEKSTIESQATTYGITTAKTTYTTAYNTLSSYITPLLANLSVTSDIVGTTFRTNFKNYYDAKTTLLKGISDAAKSLADNAYDYAVAPNVNLLQNGGAEIYTGKYGANIPDGWTIWQPSNLCIFTRRLNDATWTIAGNASFEINSGSSTTNTNGVYYQDYLGATPGKTYTLSGKLGTHRCTGFIQMVFMDAIGNWLLSKEVSKTNDSSTTAVLKMSGVAPTGTTKIRVHLNKDVTMSGQANSYMFADNIKLEVGDKATAYVEAGNSDAINNGVQLGQKYQNVETNSTDGIKVTNSDGSTSKLNGNGLEIRGGNVKMYDSAGRLVLDGRGVNPLETSGWGITSGLTLGIQSETRGDFVEVQYLGPDVNDWGQANVYLQLNTVAGLPWSGALYMPGNSWLGTVNYDSPNSSNNTVRTSASAYLGLKNGCYLWNKSPSGSIALKITSGSAILKNGVYVNIPNDVYLNVPVSSSVDDEDGWQYRVIYINSAGSITYMNAGTSGGVRDEWNIDVYPANPRNTVDSNAVILGVILCGGNGVAKKPFGSHVIMHPDFRDERAVKVIDKVSSGGKYSATIQKSVLATSSGSYGAWAGTISLSEGQLPFPIALPVGQGKRIANVSISSVSSLSATDDSQNYGATLFLGLKDPCKNITQPKWSISYSNNYIDNGYNDGNINYLVPASALGWSYMYISDAWLEIGADGEVYLRINVNQQYNSETRNIRINWMCW